jgi:hypothetical protein
MTNASEDEKPLETQDELPWPEGSTEKAYEETNASMDQLSERLQEPEKSMDAVILEYHAKSNERRRKSKEALKDTCAVLFEAGITRVEIGYDGYGDSGGIEQVSFFKDKKLLKSTEVDSLGLPSSTTQQSTYDKEKEEYQYKDVECTVGSKIEECAYEFLPCGWEINEGSFGDLVINTEKAKATLMHNTRVESSEYSEVRYDLSAEEGLASPPWISDTV